MAFRPELVDLLDPRGLARKQSYVDLLEGDSLRRSRDLASDYDEASAPDRLAALRGQNRARDANTEYEAQTLPSRVSKVRDEAAASTRTRNFYDSLPPYMQQPEAPTLPPEFGPQPAPPAEPNLPPYDLRPEAPVPAGAGPVPSRDALMYEAMRSQAMGPAPYFQETRPPEPVKPPAPQFETGEDQFSYVWNPTTKQWDKTNLRMPKPADKPADVRASIAQDRRREQLGEKSVTFAAMVKAFNDLDKATGGIYGNTPIPGLSGKILGKGWGAFNKFMESPEGAAIRIPLYTLINKVLKRESGAAVSEQEFERIKNQLGVSLLDSEQAFRLGVRMMLEQERDAQRQLEAGFGQAAVESLKAEGGLTSGDLPKKPEPKPKAGPFADPDKEARYQAWKKANGK
jgi:hypothetical protein